jgi:hypothetical protein
LLALVPNSRFFSGLSLFGRAGHFLTHAVEGDLASRPAKIDLAQSPAD